MCTNHPSFLGHQWKYQRADKEFASLHSKSGFNVSFYISYLFVYVHYCVVALNDVKCVCTNHPSFLGHQWKYQRADKEFASLHSKSGFNVSFYISYLFVYVHYCVVQFWMMKSLFLIH